MAHFALLRASEGLWVGVVTQAEFWQLDSRIFKCINGDEGGTWAPSSPIVIGGSGLTVTGTFGFTGGDFVIGASDADTLTINATTALEGPVNISDDVTIESSGSLTATGAVALNGAVSIGGLTEITGSLSVGSSSDDAPISIELGRPGGNDALDIYAADVSITGDLELAGSLTAASLGIDGLVTVAGPVTMLSGSCNRLRLLSITSSVTLNGCLYDIVEQQSDVVAASTLNLTHTDVEEGQILLLVNRSSAYALDVQNNGAGIDGVRYSDGSGGSGWSLMIYSVVAGGWRSIMRHGSVSPS